MEITRIRVSKVKDKGSIIGYANITIDNAIAINGIKIVQAPRGRFIAMPSYKTSKVDENGKPVYSEVLYPISTEVRSKLTTIILDAFDSENADAK